jgi:uncharacterized peroxidase-related enzyme
MTHFTVHTPQTAPAGSRQMLEDVKKALGFIPNLYAVFAESPAALQGALAISEAFSRSTLSPLEQQLVALAVSEANDCEFCVAAHSTFAKRVKADPMLVDAILAREPLSDARYDSLVTFTRKVVEQRGYVTDTDLEAFFQAGYTKEQVIEVVLGVGMKTFNNYVDHIAHVPLNDQFKAEAWPPKRNSPSAAVAAREDDVSLAR